MAACFHSRAWSQALDCSKSNQWLKSSHFNIIMYILSWIKLINEWQITPNLTLVWSFPSVLFFSVSTFPNFSLFSTHPPPSPSASSPFSSSYLSTESFSLFFFVLHQISSENLTVPGAELGPGDTKMNGMHSLLIRCVPLGYHPLLAVLCLSLPDGGGPGHCLGSSLASSPLSLHSVNLRLRQTVSKVTHWWGITVKQHEDI